MVHAGCAKTCSAPCAVNFKDGDSGQAGRRCAQPAFDNGNPCNAGASNRWWTARLLELAAAGAKPQTAIGGPTGSDAIGMGTEGMRYSLPSREAISRAATTIGTGSHQDGRWSVHRRMRRKNKPVVRIIGMLFANVPAIYIDAGTIKPGKWRGEDKRHCLGVPVRWRIQCRKDVTRRLRGHRTQCLPGRVMASVGGIHSKHNGGAQSQRFGLDVPDRLTANGGGRSGKAGSGRQVRTRAFKNAIEIGSQAARHRHAKKSIWNAVATVMAYDSRLDQCGTSHSCHQRKPLLSGQMDVGRLRGRPAEGPRPLCDLKPSGRYDGGRLSSCRRRAAGAENVARPWRSARRVHDLLLAARWRRNYRTLPMETPKRPRRDLSMVESQCTRLTGHLKPFSRANLAPDGCIAKNFGDQRERRFIGAARVFGF